MYLYTKFHGNPTKSTGMASLMLANTTDANETEGKETTVEVDWQIEVDKDEETKELPPSSTVAPSSSSVQDTALGLGLG